MANVAVVRCEDYESQRVFDAVKRAVDLIGGIGEFVKPGMKVLVKPNLLSPRPPEAGVDTHPEVVRAVTRLVKGAGGVPVIGDSPGGYGANIDEVFDKSGMRRVAKEEGVELVKFTASKIVGGIPISRYVFDSDCVISIPKFKTHCVTVLTAAIKNMFGTVTGIYKAECHAKALKDEDFAKVIAKVYSVSRPHLNILDGIVAMEGDGPAGGTLRKMNLVMASRDAVAMDVCIAKVMGLKPFDIPVTKEAYEMGLGEADPARIEMAGDDIDSFTARSFLLSKATPLRFLPRPVAKFIGGLLRYRPHIDKELCTGCNLCKISCPVDAIVADKDYCRINYTKCVRCLCCYEVCPYNAISIKRNVVTKYLWG